MGYRSSVAIGISIQSFRDLWEREKEYVTKRGSLLDSMTKFVERENGTVAMFWDDIEWHRLPTARRLEDFLSEIINERTRSYTFLRVGENLDDVEEDRYKGSEEEEIGVLEIQRKVVLADMNDTDKQWDNPDFNSLENL